MPLLHPIVLTAFPLSRLLPLDSAASGPEAKRQQLMNFYVFQVRDDFHSVTNFSP